MISRLNEEGGGGGKAGHKAGIMIRGKPRRDLSDSCLVFISFALIDSLRFVFTVKATTHRTTLAQLSSALGLANWQTGLKFLGQVCLPACLPAWCGGNSIDNAWREIIYGSSLISFRLTAPLYPPPSLCPRCVVLKRV